MRPSVARVWSVWVEVALAGNEVLIDDLLEDLKQFAPVITHDEFHVGVGVTLEARDAQTAVNCGVDTVLPALRRTGIEAEFTIERVEAADSNRTSRELGSRDFPPMLGASELAVLLSVSRQRVHELRASGRLPKPVEVLASGPIWSKPTIEAFVKRWDRSPGRRRKDDTA